MKRGTVTLNQAIELLRPKETYDLGGEARPIRNLIGTFTKIGQKVIPCRTNRWDGESPVTVVHMSTRAHDIKEVFYSGIPGVFHHDTIDTISKQLTQRVIQHDTSTGRVSVATKTEKIKHRQTLGYRLSAEKPFIKVIDAAHEPRRPVGQLEILVNRFTHLAPEMSHELGLVERILVLEASVQSSESDRVNPLIIAAKAAIQGAAS